MNLLSFPQSDGASTELLSEFNSVRSIFLVLLVLQVILGIGYVYQYRRSKQRYYLWLGLSMFFTALASLLAVTLTLNFTTILIISIFALLSELTFTLVSFLVLCCLCRDWISSLPDLIKQGTKNIVLFIFFAFSLSYIAWTGIGIASLFFNYLNIGIFIFAALSCIFQVSFLLLVGWLWIQVMNAPLVILKKSQLVLLFVLGLCCLFLFLVPEILTYIIKYFVWGFLTLWPGALIGFDVTTRKQEPAV